MRRISAFALILGLALVGIGAANVTPTDPFNGVPACTDAIADAGGICHGEPR